MKCSNKVQCVHVVQYIWRTHCPIMLTKCLMLLLAYYAQNDASIIGASLVVGYSFCSVPSSPKILHSYQTLMYTFFHFKSTLPTKPIFSWDK